ncbi:MAG: glycosyltransferase [Planctomycetota bacterium]
MKILLVSPYFPPLNAVASRRVYTFARTWADAGHDVTVLTTTKRDDQVGMERSTAGMNIIDTSLRTPAFLRRVRASAIGQVSDTTPAPHKAGLKQRLRAWTQSRGVYSSVRMPDLTDFWVNGAIDAATSAAHRPWDVVVSSSGPYTAHRVAHAIRAQDGSRTWVADFRDLWTQNHARRGVFPFTLRERMLERQMFACVDGMTTVSEGLAQTLRQRTRAPIEVIYNGYEESAHRTLEDARVLPADGLKRLVYTGTWYPDGQQVQPFFDAWRALIADEPSVARAIRLVVAGQDGRAWMAIAEQNGLADMVEHHGELDGAAALRMQRDADALLLLDWHDASRGVLTGKIFDYLRQTAPILTIGGETGSPIGSIIEAAGRGLVLGHDVPRIADVLQTMVNAPADIHTEPVDAVIQSYDGEHQAQRMLDMLMTLTADAAGTDPVDPDHA